MAGAQRPGESPTAARNRKTLRALMAIVLVLVAATILAGIRW